MRGLGVDDLSSRVTSEIEDLARREQGLKLVERSAATWGLQTNRMVELMEREGKAGRFWGDEYYISILC